MELEKNGILFKALVKTIVLQKRDSIIIIISDTNMLLLKLYYKR